MIFAALALLMLLVAASAVAIPLWRGVRSGRAAPEDQADAVHRLQLEELERDLASGTLAESDYQAARRDLLAERSRAVTRDPSHDTSKGWRRGSALLAAFFILVAAPALYWYYGSWRAGAEGVEQASVPAVEQMVADLSARLHSTDGDDLQGWVMLGHSYVVMGRYPDAVDAYRHARGLAGDGNPDVLAGYAEASTLADPTQFMSQALPLFEKVLLLDPANPQALWYGGLGAFERGDNKLAVSRWQALLRQDPPADYRQVIEKYIVKAGGKPDAAAATATGTAIRVHVSLSPAIQAKANPDETLFVFALPEREAGGPPLAARRFKVKDLPLDVTLTDQDAPIPGHGLSGQVNVMVLARISMAGTPERHVGDLMGQASWSKTDAKPLAIVIDAVVK
ncbi:MAG TPA: c-type cytochrome biogenesis protein CcmI [Gammaproteobacteria bacterium]|jgi:cytochrome c-type biogenesis protein CcmH|nr:c-type cytochrome biogenesis protein CcmI [Gammaproteobacteria bacterium]